MNSDPHARQTVSWLASVALSVLSAGVPTAVLLWPVDRLFWHWFGIARFFYYSLDIFVVAATIAIAHQRCWPALKAICAPVLVGYFCSVTMYFLLVAPQLANSLRHGHAAILYLALILPIHLLFAVPALIASVLMYRFGAINRRTYAT
jgi:hypothetical protein